MGMFTEFHFNSELKKDTPAVVMNTLGFMLGVLHEPAALPDHPLFSTDRWQSMLQSDSYYFDADTHSTLRLDRLGGWYLCIRCNLQNHCQEIQKLVDWIRPYLKKTAGEFLGFYRYEEADEPTLIFF